MLPACAGRSSAAGCEKQRPLGPMPRVPRRKRTSTDVGARRQADRSRELDSVARLERALAKQRGDRSGARLIRRGRGAGRVDQNGADLRCAAREPLYEPVVEPARQVLVRELSLTVKPSPRLHDPRAHQTAPAL